MKKNNIYIKLNEKKQYLHKKNLIKINQQIHHLYQKLQLFLSLRQMHLFHHHYNFQITK